MKSFMIAAAALLSLVAAAPTTGASLERRNPGNVFLCAGTGFDSECSNFFVGVGTDWRANCKRIPEPMAKTLGSAGPDRGALCRVFDEEHSNCTGSGLAILSWPGNSNLYAGSDVGHKAEYISCVTCTACQG